MEDVCGNFAIILGNSGVKKTLRVNVKDFGKTNRDFYVNSTIVRETNSPRIGAYHFTLNPVSFNKYGKNKPKILKNCQNLLTNLRLIVRFFFHCFLLRTAEPI